MALNIQFQCNVQPNYDIGQGGSCSPDMLHTADNRQQWTAPHGLGGAVRCVARADSMAGFEHGASLEGLKTAARCFMQADTWPRSSLGQT